MKKLLILLVGCFVLVGFLKAGVQDYIVTPSTLADWQVSGADRNDLQAADALTLPAGAEVSRTFSGGAVLLYSVSSPHFGLVSGDWPVMQVGPAGLTLTRQGNQGKLALLVGDTVSALPLTVKLGASGSPVQPLELVIGYDPRSKVGVVVYGEQALSFKGTASAPSVEVAVAAGERHSWPQDSLEVLVIGSDDQPDAPKSGDNADAAKRAALLKAATEKLREVVGVIGGESGQSATTTTATPNTRAGAGLEVFTPPAVRHSAATVRQIIAKNRQK